MSSRYYIRHGSILAWGILSFVGLKYGLNDENKFWVGGMAIVAGNLLWLASFWEQEKKDLEFRLLKRGLELLDFKKKIKSEGTEDLVNS